MKKKQIVFHAVFLAAVCLAFLPFVLQYFQAIAKDHWAFFSSGTDSFYFHGILIVPTLCLIYGAIAPWMHPTKRPLLRIVRSVLLGLAVIWILVDFFFLDFFFMPSPEQLMTGKEHKHSVIGGLWDVLNTRCLSHMRFNYLAVVLLSGILHVGELYFPYPRKGKKGDWFFCLLPALAVAVGVVGFFYTAFINPKDLIGWMTMLSWPLSLYVLYGSGVRLFRRGIRFRRKILSLFSLIFALLCLSSPLPVVNVLSLWSYIPLPILVLLFYFLLACCFFAQWALGVLQRSLEANWEKEDREKEQSAQEQEVQAFPAEQESEALPVDREQEALPTAQEASV